MAPLAPLLLAASAAAQQSLLRPHSVDAPDSTIFPDAGISPVRQYGPRFYTYEGPKQTNKFWASWAVDDTERDYGNGPVLAPADYSIFVMPYTLGWLPDNTSVVAELAVSHNIDEEVVIYGGGVTEPDRIQQYYTPFAREFSLGAVEQLDQFHEINSETLFGVHISVKGTGRKITYPIFQGMVYVSGRYEGDITPKVSADEMAEVTRVSDGIWKFVNARGTEFRVYALTPEGAVVDASYTFDSSGELNKNLDGWVRIARVQSEGDAAILDSHAGAVLWNWEMDLKEGGILEYTFEAQPDALDPSSLIHFAYPHHLPLMTNVQEAGLSPMKPPTKGDMTAVVGLVWTMTIETATQEALTWLPVGTTLSSDRAATILDAARADLADWESVDSNGKQKWQPDLLRDSYYWSGKGFQKLATVCLILEELAGSADEGTVRCINLLALAFTCFHDAAADATLCEGMPSGAFYDLAWGGIPSRLGFYPPDETLPNPCYDYDFGNACYNDHHYHYGYFVVAGAILVKLRPAMKDDAAFVTWIQTLMRDTANPSADDTYFPPFRCFDFFDFHSWSRGNMPDPDGKDQESTSEEINLLYGLILWGRIMEVPSIQSLGATMLALESVAINDYFLMKNGNPNHDEDFVKNHVTGIFFQNKVRYDTWFGRNKEFIHGIQMLPLSAALQTIRDQEFCQQEWDDVLVNVAYDAEYEWSSLITTGGLAVIQPELAWDRMNTDPAPALDSGLTKSFALYWTAKYMPDSGSPSPTPTPTGPGLLVYAGIGLVVLAAVGALVYCSMGQPQQGGDGNEGKTELVSS